MILIGMDCTLVLVTPVKKSHRLGTLNPTGDSSPTISVVFWEQQNYRSISNKQDELGAIMAVLEEAELYA